MNYSRNDEVFQNDSTGIMRLYFNYMSYYAIYPGNEVQYYHVKVLIITASSEISSPLRKQHDGVILIISINDKGEAANAARSSII